MKTFLFTAWTWWTFTTGAASEVDHLGFHVWVKTQDGMRGVRIAFFREVTNPAETRNVLIEMVQRARSQV
jgi:hypothetical protein